MALIVSTLAIIVATFLLTSPVPQDPRYHQFADSRPLIGISNFGDVASNLPFLIVGLWGLNYVRRHGSEVCVVGIESAYLVFFTGVVLTAFGSGYYHLYPANGPLMWDRVPMTIGFAGLFTVVVGEFVSPRVARNLLLPLLAAGIGSVSYWALTEARGAGDLRPYAIVQFLPLLLILVMLLLYKPRIGAAKYYWLMLLCYVLAKIAEHFDAAIFSAGSIVSGHTLKHLFSATIPATMLVALMARRNAKHRIQ